MSAAWSLGRILNRAQTTFVGLLRVWSIPIVLLLSLASGYTTYFGMAHFITPWIALIITVAVQSILVIASLEIASIHFRANPPRYVMVLGSLLVSITVSVSFSYFKFYEISERENLRNSRSGELQAQIATYLDRVFEGKSALIAAKRQQVEKTRQTADHAFLGTLPDLPPAVKFKAGPGGYYRHYQKIHEEERRVLQEMEARLEELDQRALAVREQLLAVTGPEGVDGARYQAFAEAVHALQNRAAALFTAYGAAPPQGPGLPPYGSYSRGVTPTLAMWQNFSWFAFACAVIVDFFTFLLSYRLEFTAPGPLTEQEQRIAYYTLRQFSQVRINDDDEMELVIEKTELERARRYADWPRLFGAALLLSRGYLRKVDGRSVEFAPNLYPLIAEWMSRELRSRGDNAPADTDEAQSK